jgi:hypothetical protein
MTGNVLRKLPEDRPESLNLPILSLDPAVASLTTLPGKITPIGQFLRHTSRWSFRFVRCY